MGYDPVNPTTKGRYCPKMGKKCPGTEDKCAFWRTQEVTIKNEKHLIQNCLFVLQFETAYQGVAEEIRTQQTIHHLNNQIAIICVALQRGAPIPLLSGNLRKDVKVLRELAGVPEDPVEGGEDGQPNP